jgi:hypothetical protein
MDAAPATLTTKHEAPDIGELFAGFFILGLTGFGGVLPLAAGSPAPSSPTCSGSASSCPAATSSTCRSRSG